MGPCGPSTVPARRIADDPSSQAWDFFGRGIDAFAAVPGRAVGSGGPGSLQRDLYAFRGPEVVELTATTQPGQPGGAPRRIGDLWPQVPVTFRLGVDSAAEVGGALYLFKGGRYVRADGSQAPVTLADLPGWPKTVGIEVTSRGILFAGKWRTQDELNQMSDEDMRNTLIVELSKHTNQPEGYFQGYKNTDDLVGKGAVVVFLRDRGIRDDATLKTMSDADNERRRSEKIANIPTDPMYKT